MGFLDLFRRKQENETSRMTRLLRSGRIVEGNAVDIASDTNGNGAQVFYSYKVGGIVYESSQTLNSDQLLRKASYAPGSRITIRYDPHQPANSTLV